jgi:hypothetical protein
MSTAGNSGGGTIKDLPISTRIILAVAVVVTGVWLGNKITQHDKPTPVVVATFCNPTTGLWATWSDGHISPIGIC